MARKLGITIQTLDMLETGIFPQHCTIRLLYNIQMNFDVSPSDCCAVLLETVHKPQLPTNI